MIQGERGCGVVPEEEEEEEEVVVKKEGRKEGR